MFKSLLAALSTFLIAGCATAPSTIDSARIELAPTGKLRAGMDLGNTLFSV